jgi:hypothetical protein
LSDEDHRLAAFDWPFQIVGHLGPATVPAAGRAASIDRNLLDQPGLDAETGKLSYVLGVGGQQFWCLVEAVVALCRTACGLALGLSSLTAE